MGGRQRETRVTYEGGAGSIVERESKTVYRFSKCSIAAPINASTAAPAAARMPNTSRSLIGFSSRLSFESAMSDHDPGELVGWQRLKVFHEWGDYVMWDGEHDNQARFIGLHRLYLLPSCHPSSFPPIPGSPWQWRRTFPQSLPGTMLRP